MTKKTSKIHKRAEEGRWIGFDDSSKGHRVYWPTRRTVSVEYDVQFTPAPDLPLLEGEIGDVYFDFDALEEPSEPAVKPEAKISPEPVNVIDQGNQEAVKTQNPDTQPEATTNDRQPQSLKEPIPDPIPFKNAPTVKAPA